MANFRQTRNPRTTTNSVTDDELLEEVSTLAREDDVRRAGSAPRLDDLRASRPGHGWAKCWSANTESSAFTRPARWASPATRSTCNSVSVS